MDISPKEKWERITNPKTVDDYGLSIGEIELETFEEGKKIISGIRALTNNNERNKELMRMLGANANDSVERIRYGVITLYANENRK